MIKGWGVPIRVQSFKSLQKSGKSWTSEKLEKLKKLAKLAKLEGLGIRLKVLEIVRIVGMVGMVGARPAVQSLATSQHASLGDGTLSKRYHHHLSCMNIPYSTIPTVQLFQLFQDPACPWVR
jgi:hypothetical protein